MDTQFFIRKSHAGSPANKLQKAILDVMPAYCNQLTDEPNVFIERLTNRINYINCQFPRCSPMKVGSNPLGQYLRQGGEQGKVSDQEQGARQGWRVSISGLVELELMPVKGTLAFDKPDPYVFMVLRTATDTDQTAQQMSVFLDV